MCGSTEWCQELAGLVEQYGEGQSVRTSPSLKHAAAGSPHIIGDNRPSRTLTGAGPLSRITCAIGDFAAAIGSAFAGLLLLTLAVAHIGHNLMHRTHDGLGMFCGSEPSSLFVRCCIG